jgi:predicted ATPase
MADEAATRALALAEEQGFPLVAGFARVMSGWARSQLGRASEGVALIHEGMDGLAQIGARAGFTLFLILLAEAQALDGATTDALDTLEKALHVNPEELLWRPEAFRLRGALRLLQGQTELAEADLREAIALAQKMSAKAYELRATTSLARLLAKQGKRNEARATLADIYNWFTEGFDTADLKDANALLEELAD